MGEAILRGEDHPDYAISHWPQDRMLAGDWFPTQFVRDEVVQTFVGISEGKWFPTASGKTVGQQGPAGQRIRDSFVKSSHSTSRQALWNHKTDIQRTMASKPDSYISPKAGKEQLANSYWQQRSKVLIPVRLSPPNTRVTAVLSETAIVTIGASLR